MAIGSLTTAAVTKERAEQYKGRVTPYVIIACIVAATGGSLFGYDIGISGNSLIYHVNHKFFFLLLFFNVFRIFNFIIFRVKTCFDCKLKQGEILFYHLKTCIS